MKTIPANSYLWALRVLLICAGAGISGCVLFFTSRYIQFEVSDILLESILYVGIGCGLFCLVKLYRALDREPDLDEATRQRLKNAVLFAGPAGALEVVLYMRRHDREPR